ncbi:putative lanosterol 14-alpha demethylase [Folsomia candida]|uniref:Putative lanosterol 14-alpha demethylase n=1 Tax=Folsomia candida TaxID=158441 RepID=A0A226EVL4_FOLCA|nr:putative lanosterol 14-alpha demethylase [Folsomia candida]
MSDLRFFLEDGQIPATPFLTSLLTLVIWLLLRNWTWRSRNTKENRYHDSNYVKGLPLVRGSLPIIGHGLQFSLNKTEFLKQCYATYGNAFKIKIFRVTMAVFCDRSYASELFKCGEEKLSFYEMLKGIYLGEAFKGCGLKLSSMLGLIKKGTSLKTDLIFPVMQSEAMELISNLRHESKHAANQLVDIKTAVSRYVSTTSAKCLIGVNLTEAMFQDLEQFACILNHGVIASYFLPKWIIRFFIQWRLDKLCSKIGTGLNSEIETYRQDKDKKFSLILRAAVDSTNEVTGLPLSNKEIANIFACILYVSSENTSLGLINTLIEISTHPEVWNKVRAEVQPLLANNDIRGIMDAPFLDACILESARLNSHLFAIGRTPTGMKSLGGYSIGDVDTVAICELLVHIYGSASNVFSDATRYNPDRYFLDAAGKKEPQDILTWGSDTGSS